MFSINLYELYLSSDYEESSWRHKHKHKSEHLYRLILEISQNWSHRNHANWYLINISIIEFLGCSNGELAVPTRSLLPNRTLHYLPVPEDRIVFGIVHQGGPQHSKVENLVASTTKVKLSRSAALWTPCHVDYGPLDIDVSTEGVDPEWVLRDILIHKAKHEEHGARWDTQDHEHGPPHLSVLGTVELWYHGDGEACNARSKKDGHIDVLIDYRYKRES